MKLLYLSCHAVLEYDELKLFESLNIDYFSLGSYINPQDPADPIRPPLTHVVDPDIHRMAPDRDHIPKEFFDRFDIIVIMHIPQWITNNWENMKHKRVIWRTIGQSTPAIEESMQKYVAEGLEIVRYSPTEARIQNYAGHKEIIRFYKDPKEFGPWNGHTQEVITFAQNMKARGEFCNYDIFEHTVRGLNAHVYGPKNQESGELNGGFLSYLDMKNKYKNSRVYFYTGTQPAAYTLNFMEAWISGIPVVAIGPSLANSLHISGKSYEAHELLGTSGEYGFWSDTVIELRNAIEMFYFNPSAGEKITEKARNKAIEIFGVDNIRKQWKTLLGV